MCDIFRTIIPVSIKIKASDRYLLHFKNEKIGLMSPVSSIILFVGSVRTKCSL